MPSAVPTTRWAWPWSLAFYRHPQRPDGIIYHSRLNESLNIAVYDRAVPDLVADDVIFLTEAAELAEILNRLGVKII